MSSDGMSSSALPAEAEDFSEESATLVRRTAAACFDRGEAVMCHHERWQRGERRGCGSTSDWLVGMAEGLRDVLTSWGVPGANLWPGEFEAVSYFFEKRRWDFAVVDASKRPLALIELKYAGARHGHGRLRRDVETVAAMCVDARLAEAPAAPDAGPARKTFRAAVFVAPGFRHTGALRNERLRLERERAGTARLANAANRLVAAGLLDAAVALHLDGASFAPFSPSLSPETLFRKLFAFLKGLPKDTWCRDRWGMPKPEARASRQPQKGKRTRAAAPAGRPTA